ncbi:hypothetical protein HanRHA438_Chr05g0209271 [Helianthus annuus]|nr:hypothetical protein HanRHA438_Chr05g0209271 [Helianthus annuus]
MKVSHVHPFSHLYVFFFARCHNQVHHAKTKSRFSADHDGREPQLCLKVGGFQRRKLTFGQI